MKKSKFNSLNMNTMTDKELEKYSKMYYFAYGSNLLIEQMFTRCSQAEQYSKAMLNDYKLMFRNVADIDKRKGEVVFGALYTVSKQDILNLNIYEGYPYKYIIKEGYVDLPDGSAAKCFWYEIGIKDNYKIEQPQFEYLLKIMNGYAEWNIDGRQLMNTLKRTFNTIERSKYKNSKYIIY